MLSKIYKNHNKWLNIVKKLGGGDYSEDIVQEMYLKLSKIELKEQTIDTFVYYVLRNMTFDLHRKKSNIFKVDLEDCVFLEYLEDQGKEELETIYERIEDEVEDWHWYDQKLFNLHIVEGMSMRKISRETGISVSSIFKTIKSCKKRLRE